MDRCEKISGEFVVAGRNGPKVLNFIEEALDEVALAIKCEIAIAFGRSVAFGASSCRRWSTPARNDGSPPDCFCCPLVL